MKHTQIKRQSLDHTCSVYNRQVEFPLLLYCKIWSCFWYNTKFQEKKKRNKKTVTQVIIFILDSTELFYIFQTSPFQVQEHLGIIYLKIISIKSNVSLRFRDKPVYPYCRNGSCNHKTVLLQAQYLWGQTRPFCIHPWHSCN